MKDFLKGFQKEVTKLTLDFIISGEIISKLRGIAKINPVLFGVASVASCVTTMTLVDIIINEADECGDKLTFAEVYDAVIVLKNALKEKKY